MIDERHHKNVWTTTYRSVSVEIVNWFMDRNERKPTPVWNYYLLIHEHSVPFDQRSKIFLKSKWEKLFGGRPRLSYDYLTSGFLYNLDWHGGITYYDIEGGLNGSPRIVKAGCDYLHYWEEGLESSYNKEKLLHDAQKTIDDLRESIPNLRYKCSYFGTWHDESEGIYENNKFTSNKGLAK